MHATRPASHSLLHSIATDSLRLPSSGRYMSEKARLYSADTTSWLTPVELFAPWYSRAIARWLAADVAGKSFLCPRHFYDGVDRSARRRA
eukprot:SAG11_NODE_3021_length_2757_cov_2.291196_2_plen_90_part_00